jgi:hypothetical protein
MQPQNRYSLVVMTRDPLTSSDWSARCTSLSSGDSTPKWFTEVELDLRERWTESTIEYVPTVDYADSWFTRVEFTSPSTPAIPGSTPAG